MGQEGPSLVGIRPPEDAPNRFLPGVRALEQSVLGALSDAERKTLMRLLGKVLSGAAAVAAGAPITLDGRRHRPTRSL